MSAFSNDNTLPEAQENLLSQALKRENGNLILPYSYALSATSLKDTHCFFRDCQKLEDCRIGLSVSVELLIVLIGLLARNPEGTKLPR